MGDKNDAQKDPPTSGRTFSAAQKRPSESTTAKTRSLSTISGHFRCGRIIGYRRWPITSIANLGRHRRSTFRWWTTVFGSRFCVSTEVSVEDLAKLDDVVYNAVKNAGRAIEDEQTALNQKLDRVRKRRMDTWDESCFQ